jgi:hypothetical protein
MKMIRIVGIAAFVAAGAFIFIFGPISGPGEAPVVYWNTGVALLVVGAVAFIVMGVLSELSKQRASGPPR